MEAGSGWSLSAPLFPFHFSLSSLLPGAGRGAKDFTALGGKVGSPGPGVETEEGEGVEVRDDGAKLLTLGVGEVDKDAVLQAAKAQIDRLKAASQEIVLEVLHIGRGLGGGGVETPGLGLVKKVVNEVNELAARGGDFGDHDFRWRVSLWPDPLLPHQWANGSGQRLTLQEKRSAARGALGDGSVGRVRPGYSSGARPRATAAVSFVVSFGSETVRGIGSCCGQG